MEDVKRKAGRPKGSLNKPKVVVEAAPVEEVEEVEEVVMEEVNIHGGQ